MYQPLGLCLNDFDISYNPHTKEYELIHIQGPPISTDAYVAATMETSYGWATSKDLIHWQGQRNIFGVSMANSVFDNGALWTMHTVYSPNNKKRFMFYTGVSRENYYLQHIGLAYYDFETANWTRHSSEPVVTPDPAYYQMHGKMGWRDPHVVFDKQSNHYVMFIAAKDKRYNENKNGCVAMATSANLTDWEVHPPMFSPQTYEEIECPVYYNCDGEHYLFISVGDTRQVHICKGESLTGPYTEISRLTKPHQYAPRIIKHNNQDIFMHTQWIKRPNANDQYLWSRGYLDDPKLLIKDKNGGFTLKKYIP